GDEAGRLIGDRVDHRRVAVADVVHGDAGHAVDVAAPLSVEEGRALAAHEGHRLSPVGRHQGRRLPLDRELVDHAVILVPMPASVKISTSTEWGTRPSMTWTASTP